MRNLLLIACTVTMFSAAHAETPASHPILGTWELDLPQLSCSETYYFHSDGTSTVKSAAEVSESRFSIAAKPSDNGFYKFTDRLVKTNGKKDCTGRLSPIGHVATNYIAFHRSGDLFVMCADESLRACIGPFRRVVGLAI